MGPDLVELFEDGKAEDEVAAIIHLSHFKVLPERVRVISQFGDIVTVRLMRSDLPGVSGAPEVIDMVAGGTLLGPDLELDSAESGEPSSDTILPTDERRPPDETVTGRGVVVGVVDWGFDFAHPDFRNPDGTTRILALWDQRGGKRPDSPTPFGYGVVHDRSAIDRALSQKDPYASLQYHPADADTGIGCHGTHVASIAAGTGGVDRPAGIAPEAQLVLVHNAPWDPSQAGRLGDSVTLLEALDFTLRAAGDQPCVINLSMGCHADQHDGSTKVELGLDALVRAAPGRAVCMSVGNYFNKRIHASGRLRSTQEREFDWSINEKTPSDYNQLQIWYSWQDRFEAILRSPDGATSGRVKAGERAKFMSGGVEVGNIYHRGQEPDTLDNHINVFLYKEAPPGIWHVTLVGSDVIDGRFHAWIEREVNCPPCQSRFVEADADPTSTTGTICNGRRTIAVGAYDGHDPEQRIGAFSSVGPTRDGRLKPDLCAPGVKVLAARSAPRKGVETAPRLTRMSGTSMAAPHITGTVALMFQAAPRKLRIEETHNMLLESAQRVSVPEDMPDRVGIGFLDVHAAVEAARMTDAGARTFKQITVRAPAPERAKAPSPSAAPAAPMSAQAVLPEQAATTAVRSELAEGLTPQSDAASDADAIPDRDAADLHLPVVAERLPGPCPDAPAPHPEPPAAHEPAPVLCNDLFVWINAFIPRDVPGYTLHVPSGPHAGKTAIPCPAVALPVNWNCLSVGYLTDQRSFDSSPAASHRMRSVAHVRLTPPSFIRHAGAEHTTSGTTEIDKTSGAVTCVKNADMSRCAFKNFRVQPDPVAPLSGNFYIFLEVVAAASDPCVNLAADIDYTGTIVVFCAPRTGIVEVRFAGKIDSFPAFEMYAQLGGVTKTLFTAPPPVGNTVVDLLGSASTPVSGRVTFDQCRLPVPGGETLERAVPTLLDRAEDAVSQAILVPRSGGRSQSNLADLVFGGELTRAGAPHSPAAWEIFDAIVYPGRERLRQSVSEQFEVLAGPGSCLQGDLRQGDVLLRRTDSRSAHVAVIGSADLLPLPEAAARGWTPEAPSEGRYARVVEGGSRPHLFADAFGRQVTDSAGRVLPNQAILRAREDTDGAERIDPLSLVVGLGLGSSLARPAPTAAASGSPPVPVKDEPPAEPESTVEICDGMLESFEVEDEPEAGPRWSGTPEQLAFRDRVLAAHLESSRATGAKPKEDLPESALACIAGTHVETTRPTAAAAGRLLADATDDLSSAQRTGDADACRTVKLTAVSGYRSASQQKGLWLKYFAEGYYDRTRLARAQLPGGPHGEEAVAYMLRPIAKGGFGLRGRIAAPGFSNHQGGIAVDFAQERVRGFEVRNKSWEEDRKRWRASWFHQWLEASAGRFGFAPIKTEEWHWEHRLPEEQSAVSTAPHATQMPALGRSLATQGDSTGATDHLGGKYWVFDAEALPLRVAVFCSAAALSQERIDLVLYAHGLLDRCSGPPTVPGIVLEQPFALASIVEASQQPAALVVPFLEWDRHRGPEHAISAPVRLNAVLAEAVTSITRQLQHNALELRTLVIAGHSRAYGVLGPLARAHADPSLRQGALARLREVWALDTTYPYRGGHDVPSTLDWLAANPRLTIRVRYRPDSGTATLGQHLRDQHHARLDVVAVTESHCQVPHLRLPELMRGWPNEGAKTEQI
jgi:subtilisin family serine protease/LAS superfamily LD-carboxypeptidase LdcB